MRLLQFLLHFTTTLLAGSERTAWILDIHFYVLYVVAILCPFDNQD